MNELKHHGVLGMKWGIRKKTDRKVKRYTSNPVLTNGARLKKGTKISRLSRKSGESEEGHTFGIVRAGDSKMATAERMFISKFVSHSGMRVDDIYQIDMTAKADLVLPAMKEKGKIAVNKILKDSNLRHRVINASNKFLGEDRVKQIKEMGWDREKDIENLLKKDYLQA